MLDTGSAGMAPADPTIPNGQAFEPFPRQTLVGVGSVPPGAIYYSPIYDATGWKSITYWFKVYYSLPGSSAPQAKAYIETTNDPGSGVWDEMTPGGISGAMGDPPETGTVSDPGRWVRVRMEIVGPGESTCLSLRSTARGV